MIDLFKPYVPKAAIEAVADTLRTRWIGQGPKVEQFEKDFEKKFGFHTSGIPVSLSSGTAALETAYELVDIRPGDEVITTPLTCTATNLPLIRMGAKIVWADIDRETLCIDPHDVARKITSKTKAVVQVHLGGMEAKCDKFHGIVDLKLPIISDACQALGIWSGDYSCCSFQAIKHISTGDGGMIVCPNEETAQKARLMRWFGIDREKKIANNWQAYKERKMTFDIELPGTKRHMNDIAAAMGIEGLKVYDEILEHRRNIFCIYMDRLMTIPRIHLLNDAYNVYWLATVLVEDRENFAKVMFEAGIDTNLVQVRNDIYKIFGGKRADLPVMNELEDQYISIPIGMHVSEEDAHYICDVIERGW